MTKKWLNNLNKIKQDEWLKQLLSDNNLPINTNSSMMLISNNILKEQLQINLNCILEKEPFEMIRELVDLNETISEEIDFLTSFKKFIIINNFKQYLKGISIPLNVFNNIGYIFDKNYAGLQKNLLGIRAINYNSKIQNYLIEDTDFIGLNEHKKNALIQSIKSSTGWHNIDFKKHAIGSMVDILKLTVSLLKPETSNNEVKKKNKVKFLIDIFKIHFPKDDIESIIINKFFNEDKFKSFKIPQWSKKDEDISIIQVNIDRGNDTVSSILYKLFNRYNMSNTNGDSETLVLMLFNVLINIINILEEIYDELYYRSNSNNKISTSVINGSIKESIKEYRKLVVKQVERFFGLKGSIQLMNETSLYPSNVYSKGNIYRIIGGVKSIIKKENCSKNKFPIILDITTYKINEEATFQALVDMFMYKIDSVSMGGFVLHNSITKLNCLIFKRYIDKITSAKSTINKKIASEFKKLIKNIKLENVKILSNYILKEFRKISRSKLSTKTVLLSEVLENLKNKYKEYKDQEIVLLKNIVEILPHFKKELKSTEDLKDLLKIKKRNIIEYYSMINLIKVYKLLLTNIYNTMRKTLTEKGANNKILPEEFIKKLNDEITSIDKEYDKNKKNIDTKTFNIIIKKLNKNNFTNIN